MFILIYLVVLLDFGDDLWILAFEGHLDLYKDIPDLGRKGDYGFGV